MICRQSQSANGFCSGETSYQTSWVYHVSQVTDCFCKELTFSKIEFYAHIFENFLHLAWMIYVLLSWFHKMTVSSGYAKAKWHYTVENISSTVRWKLPSVFRNLNGTRMNLLCPRWEVKSVLSRVFLSFSTFRYQLLVSSLEKTVSPPRESTHLSIRGMGYGCHFFGSWSLL